MKIRYAILFAVLAALTCASLSSADPKPDKGSSRITLQMKHGEKDAELAARLARGFGKVVSREQDSFVIQLRPGADANAFLAMVRKDHAVQSAMVQAPGKLAKIEDDDKYGWKEALKFWKDQRAFPNSSIDNSAYQKAALYRDTAMAPANLSHGLKPSKTPTSMWTFLGPTNMGVGETPTNPWSGRINGIAYAPGSTSTFYAATASGGLWKTTDSGTTWTPLSDSWPFLYTSSVAVDPTNGNNIYCGTGDFDADYAIAGVSFGSGLMKSTDGGSTWTQLGVPQGFNNSSISDILIDPDTPSTITIAEGRGQADVTFSGAGFVWRSTDSGATWTKVINTNLSWSKLACSAVSAGVRYYYAISQDGTLFRSQDRGATWTQLTSPASAGFNIDRIVAHPTIQGTAYLFDTSNSVVYKTTNEGGSWTNVTGDLNNTASYGQAWYDSYIGVTQVSGIDNIWIGLITVDLSTNAGTNYADVGQVYGPGTPVLHPDQHCIVFDPTNPDAGLIGCDGGIYHFTYNPGTSTFSCTSLNAHIGVTQLYNLDIHPTAQSTVLAGAQDNSTPYSRGDNIANWEFEIGGDGGYCGINQTNPLIQFGSYVEGALFVTTDEWVNTLTQIQNQDGSGGTAFIAPFAMDPSNQDLLYSGYALGLNKYVQSTNTWTNHLGGVNLTNSYLLAVAVAPSNGQVIYTGGQDGQVWMTTNGGTTWTEIDQGSPGLPLRSITSISIDPANSSDVLVGLSGTGSGHLYRCTNPTAGGSRVWTNVSGVSQTLPDIPLNTVVRDPDITGTWYVGTDSGVMTTADSGTSWQNATGPLGLPNVQVNTLKIRHSDRMMYAATWGRGVWRILLPAPGVVQSLSANPIANPSGSSMTGTVTLYPPYPVTPTVVNLVSSAPATAGVPPTVTVPASTASANFTITANNSGYTQLPATITESLAGDPNHTVNVTVNPADYASFVGQTVPSAMGASEHYQVTLQFKNNGSTTWDTAHAFEIRSLNPTNNTTFGFNRIALTNSPVAPGGTGTFTASVLAPAAAGTYNFQWQMIQNNIGLGFGAGSTNVAVVVSKTADEAEFISQSNVPTTIAAGTDFSPTLVFKNVGTATWTNGGGYVLRSRGPYNNTYWNSNNVLLPGSIAANATATFTPTFTAPLTPGSYGFQWSMLHTSALFGDLSNFVSVTVTLGANDASFVSITGVPLSVGPGTTVNGVVTFENLGTATWDNTYSMVSRNPYLNTNWGTSSVAVTGPVAQNTNAVISHAFTAPSTPGTYHFHWRMSHGGVPFGQESADLAVVVTADAAHYVSKTGATTVNAGQDFYVQYTMQNTGTSTWSSATNFNLRSVSPTDNLTWGKNRGYLPGSGSVAPGASVTITVLCTAPTTPGAYNMQWQMNHLSQLFGETTPLIPMTVVQGADGATFFSQSGIPTSVVHSSTFTATVTMTNTGTATWSPSYSLVPVGSNTWGVASIASGTVAPSANGAFTHLFTAPATPGTYTFQMRMQDGTTKFGGSSTLVTITVT